MTFTPGRPEPTGPDPRRQPWRDYDSAGVSPYVARADHRHPRDPLLITAVLGQITADLVLVIVMAGLLLGWWR